MREALILINDRKQIKIYFATIKKCNKSGIYTRYIQKQIVAK